MAGEIQAAFNSVYTDGPTTTPDEPEKSRIRTEVGGTIQSEVDRLSTDLDGVRALATAGVNWKDPVRVASTANVSVASGLESGDIVDGVTLQTGDRVLLRAQATASQNGIYIVPASGAASRAPDADEASEVAGMAAFVQEGSVNAGKQFACTAATPIVVGTTDLPFREVSDQASLNAAIAKESMLDNPQAPIVEDLAGVFGGGAAIYVSTTLYAKEVGGSGSSRTIGASSTELPGFVKVPVSTTNLTRITVDLVTNTLAATEYSQPLPVITGDTRHIIDVQGYTYRSDFKVVSTRSVPNARILLNGPLVYDEGKILIPGLAYQDQLNASVIINPASGLFTELAVSQVAAEMYYVDRAAHLRGETAIKSAAFDAATRYGGHYTVPIAFAYGGAVAPFGQRLASIVGCEFGYGKTENDLAPVVFQASTPVDITDPALTALGFTRGWGGNNGVPYYGGDFIRRKGGWLFVRYYVQSDIDNNFGSPRVYARTASGNVQLASVVVEKVLNSRVRCYSLRVKISEDEGYIGLIAGTHSSAGRDMRVCGLQFSVSQEQNTWVSRSDYPLAEELVASDLIDDTAPDLVIPGKLYLTAGRPQVLYPGNAVEERSDFRAWSFTLDVKAPSDATRPPLAFEGSRSILLDPSIVEGSAQVVARRDSSAKTSRILSAPLAIEVAPAGALTGAAPVVHIIGDSISRWVGTSPAIKHFLQALGATPTFVGTMTGLNDASGVWSGVVNGEARGGREFADYTYEHTDVMAPVTNDVTYLALSDDDKVNYNPYLIASAPGANVYNGYKFDFASYRTRFSIAAPTHVLINLGTNDMLQQTAAVALSQIRNGLEAMVSSIVANVPTAKVGIVINQSASGADDFWDEKRSQAIRVMLDFVRDLANANVSIVPVYLHQSTESGWPMSVTSTDAETGRQTATVTDTVHFNGTAVAQYAEAASAWIANTI